MATKNEPQAEQPEETEDIKAKREANEGFGVADPDDPTLNTYDIDTQGAERPYPEKKDKPEHVKDRKPRERTDQEKKQDEAMSKDLPNKTTKDK